MENQPFNPCLELCKGSCCRRVIVEEATQADVDKLTVNHPAKYVDHERLGNAITAMTSPLEMPETGILIAKRSDNVFDIVMAQCPNLGQNNKCTIHGEHPDFCKNTVVGDETCNGSREREHMSPLDTDGMPQRRKTWVKKAITLFSPKSSK